MTRTVSTTNFNVVLIGVYQIIEYFNQIPSAPEFIEFDDSYAYLPNCDDTRALYSVSSGSTGDIYSFSCDSFDFDTSSCNPLLR